LPNLKKKKKIIFFLKPKIRKKIKKKPQKPKCFGEKRTQLFLGSFFYNLIRIFFFIKFNKLK